MSTVDRVERDDPNLTRSLEFVSGVLIENPSLGQTVMRTTSDLVGPYEVRATVGGHEITVDMPIAIGGAGSGPGPVELALGALGSCTAITYRLWAAKLGIDLDGITVEVEGDYDARGLLGVGRHGRPGLTAARVTVTLDGPSDDEAAELRAVVDEHCPVLDMFVGEVPVTTEVEV